MSTSLSIVQTLYFNSDGRDPMANNVRFLAPEFHWMSWALSCLQLKKLYGHVSLFTNNHGAEVLIERLKLPYDIVDLRLADINIHPGLGVLPKIHTYSFQDQPFLHFDGDVIMWERLGDKLLNQGLIVQNPEVADTFYRSFYNKLAAEGTWFPEIITSALNSPELIRVFNLGIVGGTDIEFFKTFTRDAFEIIDSNNALINKLGYTNFNLSYEQHLFYCLSKILKKEVSCYISEEVKDLNFAGYADFLNTPNQNRFIHLLGDYKLEEHTCLSLARRLRNDYPEYYYRVIEECKKAGLKLYLKFYNKGNDNLRDHEASCSENNIEYWEALYKEEKKQFSLAQNRFADLEDLLNTKFIAVNEIALADPSDFPIEIPAPVSLLLDFNQLILDSLDQILVKLLSVEMSFAEILDKIKLHFNTNEIEDNYELFKQTISSRLKMGIEENLFQIVE